MYLNKRLYIIIILIILCFIAGFKSVFVFTLAQLLLLGLVLAVAFDILLLFQKGNQITAIRTCSDRFSNGDGNKVELLIDSSYNTTLKLEVRDEVPDVFQYRDLFFNLTLNSRETKRLLYHLYPVKRGEYRFGLINILASTRLGLVSRRFKTGQSKAVKVYPSYLRFRQYELMAISNNLTDTGMKKIRKIGQQLELEHIKDYTKGDDYRTINWKATARRNHLMVNVFQDERSQNIYCLIDKGRTMQSASNGMTLLDFSINASLALSYVSMVKGDKAGLLTFEKSYDTLVPASRRGNHINLILDSLYKQETSFSESDFSALYAHVKKRIPHRSLLIIFSNFDNVKAMQRQLVYLRMLAKHHTVVTVFFENAEIKNLTEKEPENKVETYEKVLAEKLNSEKRMIIKRLHKNNIIALLTQPENLTVNVINKYLELKARSSF